MNLDKIIAELKKERDQLVRAIEALVGSAAAKGRPAGAKGKRKKRSGLTPEGRRRLSIAMKKRWAERRKKAQ